MNAALGVRFLPDRFAAFFAVLLADFLALFLADFRLAVFFLAAIARLPWDVRTLRALKPANYRDKQYTGGANLQ